MSAMDEAMEMVKGLKARAEKAEAEAAMLLKQKQNILAAYNDIKGKYDRSREIVSAINEIPDGHYWAWQPGEDNHLESLTIPVLIPAEWLRNILDDARVEAETEAAILREALNTIAYKEVWNSDEFVGYYCRNCHQEIGNTHIKDCPIGKALGGDAK